MTTIKINNKSITVEGHSGYSVIGSDIVCSSISTLIQATYRYLEKIGCKVKKEVKNAYYNIVLEYINEEGKNIILEFIQIAKDIEKQYNKYLKVEGDYK